MKGVLFGLLIAMWLFCFLAGDDKEVTGGFILGSLLTFLLYLTWPF